MRILTFLEVPYCTVQYYSKKNFHNIFLPYRTGGRLGKETNIYFSSVQTCTNVIAVQYRKYFSKLEINTHFLWLYWWHMEIIWNYDDILVHIHFGSQFSNIYSRTGSWIKSVVDNTLFFVQEIDFKCIIFLFKKKKKCFGKTTRCEKRTVSLSFTVGKKVFIHECNNRHFKSYLLGI